MVLTFKVIFNMKRVGYKQRTCTIEGQYLDTHRFVESNVWAWVWLGLL